VKNVRSAGFSDDKKLMPGFREIHVSGSDV
jgi:hypothetical protein